MADDKRVSDRRGISPTGGAEQTSPSPDSGREFPFPYFPPPNSKPLNNENFNTGYLKNRDGGETQHPKRRSHSQSRSASSISNLLLVATERLGQETNRANTLDARCAEVLGHLRTIVEDRDQLRRTLAKVQEELGLYKLQLDVAQNEIFRAQKIVEDVDKARVEAEEQAVKDRTLARQLASERAVWVAREEGRSEGFKEGLRQGRRWAYEAARKRSRTDEFTDDAYEEVGEDPEPYEPSAHRSSSSSRRHWSSPSRSVHSTLPDAASYASTLPVHAMSPPDTTNAPPSAQSYQPPRPTSAQSRQPSRSQSAQQQAPRPQSAQQQAPRPQSAQQQAPRPESARQQPPRQQSAQYPERLPSARSSRPLPRAPAHSPEPIDIRSVRRDAPAPARAPSPTMSDRSEALPQDDGFIPTVGADAVISLPPPHTLSRPVSTVYTPAPERGGIDLPHSARGRTRTMSNVSAVSTRLSQFDILSPPRASEAPVSRSYEVAREWRVANADPPERRRGSTEESHSSETFSTRSSAPRSQASRRAGPRRPREIVMPMPLSATMHAEGMASTQPHPAGGAPQRNAFAGPSSAPAAPPLPPPQPQPRDYLDDSSLAPPRSAIAWIKSRFNRSMSSTSVPNIEIEPPSNPASNPSTDRTVNNILLTPEDAGTTTLPQQFVPELAGALAGVQLAPFLLPDAAAAAGAGIGIGQGNGNATGSGNVIVLPDNELPRGFIPLSPILPNLHTVPPVSAPADPAITSAGTSASARPAPTPSPSPNPPPAYTPRDIYAARELPHPRPATAAGTTRPATATGLRTRSPPATHFEFEFEGFGMAGSSTVGRARGASVGSAMLGSPAPLNRPISIFSET